MKRFLLPAALCVMAFSGVNANNSDEVPARVLDKVSVLPLAITDDFEFRKTILATIQPKRDARDSSLEPMLRFERKHRLFGAIDRIEMQQRFGKYFTFFWRGNRPADVTVRLEYRQKRLGPWVQAMERSYSYVKGTQKTTFQVTGDEFKWEGDVTSWRAIVIENGRIIALNSSFLWN